MKEFKIRASATGQIMGLPRAKKDIEAGKLSKTAETYCEKWLKEQLYKRKYEFSNKYTQKGEIMEDAGIDFLADYLKLGLLIKNDKYYENDFATGTPDIILKDLIIDVKNSWSWETFPLFEKEIPTKDYYFQLQTYMILTGRKNAKLVYTLTDTPMHLIEREAYYSAKNTGYNYEDVIDDFIKKMTYTDVPDKYKIKVFDVKKDPEFENKLKGQVIKCRNYIKMLSK